VELGENATFVAGGQYFRIQYTGGTGNDVVLYAVVPEPNAFWLLALGFFTAVMRWRRSGDGAGVTPARRGGR